MNPVFFDTHVHFDSDDDPAQIYAIIRRAEAAGVAHLTVVGGSPTMNETAARVASEYPDMVCGAVGFDRDQAAHGTGDLRSNLSVLTLAKQVIQTPKARMVAIGEIGLDFHRSPQTADQQLTLLREQLNLARRLMLPVIIHCREAEEAILRELTVHRKHWQGPAERLGAIHCFASEAAFAKKITHLGYYVSFSGILTFKGAENVREAARAAPADRILIETDTPYLAPVPHRGQRNEPSFLVHVAETLAELRGTSLAEMADLTTRNAKTLFGLEP